jgi:hypothetical protein
MIMAALRSAQWYRGSGHQGGGGSFALNDEALLNYGQQSIKKTAARYPGRRRSTRSCGSTRFPA